MTHPTSSETPERATYPPTICKCGLAKSFHGVGRFSSSNLQDDDYMAHHEYEPRYEPEAWHEGYRTGAADARAEAAAKVERARRCIVQASIYLANADLSGAHEELAVALDALSASTESSR